MSALEAAQFANLLLVGFVFGTDLVVTIVINPAINSQELRTQVTAYKAIIRRFGFVMPWLLPLTLASGVVALLKLPDSSSTPFWLALAGVVALGAWEVLAFVLFPLNKQIWEGGADFPADDWRALRRRWDRLHVLRTLFTATAFVTFLLAVFLG